MDERRPGGRREQSPCERRNPGPHRDHCPLDKDPQRGRRLCVPDRRDPPLPQLKEDSVFRRHDDGEPEEDTKVGDRTVVEISRRLAFIKELISEDGESTSPLDAAENAALAAGAIMGAAEEEAMDAAVAGEAMEAAVMAESMEAAEEEAAWEAAEEAEAVYDSFLPAAGDAAVNSEPALFAAYEAAASVKGADDTAERKASAAEKAPATEAPVPAATAAPTAAPTEVPTAGPTEVPAEAETGSFFADMGDFLSETWPYLLILAVPAVTASFLRRRKK